MFTETMPSEVTDSSISKSIVLNDRHSQLNATNVHGVVRPRSLDELIGAIRSARDSGRSLIPFGGRHAMGAQQFGTGVIALDMTGLNRVLGFDTARGIIKLEAGINWAGILNYLDHTRPNHGEQAAPFGWAIAQKQTGGDDLSIGGSLSANIHGRGLTRKPIIDDIESFVLIDANGDVKECSRDENADLFRLVIGGYGLCGVIYSVRLRLVPRQRMVRVVEISHTNSIMKQFNDRISGGFLFGDFQFQIDDRSNEFLRRGIFSCYRAIPSTDAELTAEAPALKRRDWLNLLHLAHANKSAGFEAYQNHYLSTNGSQHWSDSHQFTVYVDGYHEKIDRCLGPRHRHSEMITELYVPRDQLVEFLDSVKEDLRRRQANVIYGTVRLIEKDEESFLRWARDSWACVIFNLCVEHSPQGIRRARDTFRQLIDRALELGGSYYLTYHKFARRDQLEAAYPMFSEFLKLKAEYDLHGLFQSDWYQHHRALVDGVRNA